MARDAKRTLTRRLLSGAARGAVGGLLRNPLTLAVMALPLVMVVILVLAGSMVLFVRNIGATAQACVPVVGGGDPVSPTDYDAGPDAPGPGEPPENFIPAYFAAANQSDAQLGRLGPYVLMGIHKVESSFGRSDAAGVKSGINFADCCKGPFQFYDTSEWSTWAAKSPISGRPYGRDGDGDGDVSIYSNHDGMFAAAALLHASGAPGDWSKAILAYNHSTAYRDEVLGFAHGFERTVEPPAGAPPPPAATPSQSEDPIASSEVADFAKAAGCEVEPAANITPSDGGPYSPPMPKESYTVTTLFWTWRGSYNHAGVDLGAPEGTPFSTIGDGKVTIAGPYDPDGYGTYICVEHTQQLTSCYGHPSRVDVKVGETVHRGQQIGLVGQEGDSTGPHLHFEVKLDGAPQCPANYVSVDPKLWCQGDAPGFGAQPK